jgi:mannosyltransferase
MTGRPPRIQRTDPKRVWLPLSLTWLAFALRTWSLTAQSLWRDEVDALIFATRPLYEMLATFRQPGQNGPLFFLALRPWLAATGRSEFALRFPSALAGALAVPIIYLLMRRLVEDRRPALVAALLMATAPYLVWYGQEAKMYAALTVLVPASLLLTVEVTRRGGWWRWALLYVITSLGFYTHLLAALMVPVQVLWLLLLPIAPPSAVAEAGIAKSSGRSARLRRGLAVAGYLAALILPYLPLLRWQNQLWQASTYETGFAFVPLPDILLVLASAFSRGILPVERPWTLLPYMLAVVAGVGLWAVGQSRRLQKTTVAPWRTVLLLCIWLLLPPLAVYGISLKVPVFTDRYLIWAMPAFLALAGLGVVALAGAWRPLGLATLAAIVALNLMSIGAQTVQPTKSDFRAAAQYVAANRQLGDLLVYQIPYIRYTFAYYASGQADPNDASLRGLDGPYTNNGMGKAEVGDRMARGTAGAKAAWLIASEVPLWDQQGLTEKWLANHATATQHAEFARVAVTRYELEK